MMRFQKTISMLLCALVALAGYSLEAQAKKAKRFALKGSVITGLSHIQERGTNEYFAIDNVSDTNYSSVVQLRLVGGTWTREIVFAGEFGVKFGSLAVRGHTLTITTLQGAVIFVPNMNDRGDPYFAFRGLEAGVNYGIIIGDAGETGVFHPVSRQILWFSQATAVHLRTDQPLTPVVPGDCSQIMALGLGNAWDTAFRSSTGNTRRYLVTDSGNATAPVSAPRLMQVSYDFNTNSATVTTIATGTAGQRWFSLTYRNNNAYVVNQLGQALRINVNTAVITVVATGVAQLAFESDHVVRSESGVDILYVLDYYGYVRRVNTNTGVVTLLPFSTENFYGNNIVLQGNTLVFTATFFGTSKIFRQALPGVAAPVKVFDSAVTQPGLFLNFWAINVVSSDRYTITNNTTGALYEINVVADTITTVCEPAGAQRKGLIRDSGRNIGPEFTEGSLRK